MRQWQQEGEHEPEELQDQDNQPLHPVVGDVTERLPECELEERRERKIHDCLHIYFVLINPKYQVGKLAHTAIIPVQTRDGTQWYITLEHMSRTYMIIAALHVTVTIECHFQPPGGGIIMTRILTLPG